MGRAGRRPACTALAWRLQAEEEREALEAQDLGPDPLEPYTSASRLLDLDPAVDVAGEPPTKPSPHARW